MSFSQNQISMRKMVSYFRKRNIFIHSFLLYTANLLILVYFIWKFKFNIYFFKWNIVTAIIKLRMTKPDIKQQLILPLVSERCEGEATRWINQKT